MNRRGFLLALSTTLPCVLTAVEVEAQVGVRRRTRRRVRRRIRRRMRRRAFSRVVLGRRVWVVPVGLVAGWELVHEDRIVVVKETRIVERSGARVEVAVVEDGQGKTEEVELLREDTADNVVSLEGSRLPDDDQATPGVEVEIEEEVEE